MLVGQTKSTKPLEIYVVDPEGGKEALWVTPAGQAILIDTGSPGGRDTDRIMEVINALAMKKIDILLSTHYHVDHVGGLQELVKRIPIDHFYDHGETIEDRLEWASEGTGARVPGVVFPDGRQGAAHRSETWRSDSSHRPRLAHRDIRRSRS